MNKNKEFTLVDTSSKHKKDESHKYDLPVESVPRPAREYDNEYDRVCASLQLSAIPDVLPCRDKER